MIDMINNWIITALFFIWEFNFLYHFIFQCWNHWGSKQFDRTCISAIHYMFSLRCQNLAASSLLRRIDMVINSDITATLCFIHRITLIYHEHQAFEWKEKEMEIYIFISSKIPLLFHKFQQCLMCIWMNSFVNINYVFIYLVIKRDRRYQILNWFSQGGI